MKLIAQRRLDLQTGGPSTTRILERRSKVPQARRPFRRSTCTTPFPHGRARPCGKAKPRPLRDFARSSKRSGGGFTLPPLMQSLAVARRPVPRLSVSAIEQADEFLHDVAEGRLIFADPLTASEVDENEDPTVLGTVVHNVIDLLPWSCQTNGAANGASARSHRGHREAPRCARALAERPSRRVSAEAVLRRVDAFVQSEVWAELSQARRWMREIDFLLPWPLEAPHGAERAIVAGKIDCLLEDAGAAGRSSITRRAACRLPTPRPCSSISSIQLILYAPSRP